jgi:phosphoglycolate phosphatase-like HAD superfamily hydrolase
MDIRSANYIFWDFDGVIKDSVSVKTEAFAWLFEAFGQVVVERIREHHNLNGGMSRFHKIPLYLEWAGQETSDTVVNEYCTKFSQKVLQGVIDSPWVPGVESYLRNQCESKAFILVSATPQLELEYILESLNLSNEFRYVFGAPVEKIAAIRAVLGRHKWPLNQCLMIGDAQADLYAAEVNQVPFLLRKHSDNKILFAEYSGQFIEDFLT